MPSCVFQGQTCQEIICIVIITYTNNNNTLFKHRAQRVHVFEKEEHEVIPI